METMPMPLGGLVRGHPHGADGDDLDEFRVGDAREIASILRECVEANAPLQLHATGDAGKAPGHVGATLWAADAERRRLTFAVGGGDARLEALLDAPGLVAVGYLDHVKIQFETREQVLTHGPQGSVVRAAWPEEFHRFQRRNAYRVRPAGASAPPVARLRHTDIAEMQLALRLIDVSIGGCGLLLPADVPAMQTGGVLNAVRLELDPQTALTVDLKLQHVSALGAEAGGVRLGCEFVRCDANSQRLLQRFVDQAQKRGRGLLTLEP